MVDKIPRPGNLEAGHRLSAAMHLFYRQANSV